MIQSDILYSVRDLIGVELLGFIFEVNLLIELLALIWLVQMIICFCPLRSNQRSLYRFILCRVLCIGIKRFNDETMPPIRHIRLQIQLTTKQSQDYITIKCRWFDKETHVIVYLLISKEHWLLDIINLLCYLLNSLWSLFIGRKLANDLVIELRKEGDRLSREVNF